MSLYSQDKRGLYQVLHEFVDIGARHDGGNAWCRLCQVRRYEDGGIDVVGGPLLAINDQAPELRVVWKIYAEAKSAMECRLEAPK